MRIVKNSSVMSRVRKSQPELNMLPKNSEVQKIEYFAFELTELNELNQCVKFTCNILLTNVNFGSYRYKISLVMFLPVPGLFLRISIFKLRLH